MSSISNLKEVEKIQVQTLRALMGLHGLTVTDLSTRTFVPRENIEAFLSGVTATLSDPSFKEMFRSLGLDETGELNKSRVHFWHIKMNRTRNKENLLPLSTMMKLLGEDHSAMALPKQKNITPILLKAGENRIVIFVQGPRFMTLNVSDLGLNPGSFGGNLTRESIPTYYYDLIQRCALRPNYFDLVLDGTYINEDIELLRMVALEHDITISELVAYATRNDNRPGVEHAHLETEPIEFPLSVSASVEEKATTTQSNFNSVVELRTPNISSAAVPAYSDALKLNANH